MPEEQESGSKWIHIPRRPAPRAESLAPTEISVGESILTTPSTGTEQSLRPRIMIKRAVKPPIKIEYDRSGGIPQEPNAKPKIIIRRAQSVEPTEPTRPSIRIQRTR